MSTVHLLLPGKEEGGCEHREVRAGLAVCEEEGRTQGTEQGQAEQGWLMQSCSSNSQGHLW